MPEGPSEPRAQPYAIGKIVAGKYRLERELGRGGMGVVYLAHHEVLDMPVALKLLLPEVAGSAEAASRFLNEARAAMRIKSEHVALVMDVGKLDDGTAFMVLEYLEGQDLLELQKQRGALPVEEAVDLTLQALEALSQAHVLGIIHRDVTLANLFLTKRASGAPLLKVLDFGISKALDVAGDIEITSSRAVLGSPGYMSPEQVRSSKGVDARSDVWSIGVVLYRLLANEAPFSGDSAGSVYAAILESRPARLGRLRREVSPELEAVVERCLSRDREARFASVAELAAALVPFGSSAGLVSAERVCETLGTPLHALARGAAPLGRPAETTGISTAGEGEGAAPADPTLAERSGTGRNPATRANDEGEAATREATKPRRGPMFVTLAALAILGVAIGVAVARFSAASGAKAATSASGESTSSASAPSVASARPLGIMDLPVPDSPARSDYLAALQSFHDGDWRAAMQSFTHAVAVDPDLAAAQLRLSILHAPIDPEEARAHFKLASQRRQLLDKRDRALLDVSTPYIMESPASPDAWARGLARALDEHPGDAELAFYLGTALRDRGDADLAIAAFDRATADDPTFAGALYAKAMEERLVGRTDDARTTLDRCLALPQPVKSAACLKEMVRLLQTTGDCAGVGEVAAEWQRHDLATLESFAYQAESEYAVHGSLASVEALLKRRTALPEERRQTQLFWSRELALVRGDFAGAEKDLLEQRKWIEASPALATEYSRHALYSVELVRLYEQTSRGADAAAIAETFLAGEGAWLRPAQAPDAATAEDVAPLMNAALYRARRITHEELAARRAAWIAKWDTPALRPRFRPYVWIGAYAAAVGDEDDAAEAMKALPSFGAVPDSAALTFDEQVAVGRTLALASARDASLREGAVTMLTRATSSCFALHRVTLDTEARAALGRALDAGGDRPGACRAYKAVEKRWGNAAGSLTARDVTARARAAGCTGAD